MCSSLSLSLSVWLDAVQSRGETLQFKNIPVGSPYCATFRRDGNRSKCNVTKEAEDRDKNTLCMLPTHIYCV